MAAKKPIGVLLSGGIDSVALLGHFLKKKQPIWPVYIRCGLRWERSEIYWTKQLVKKLGSTKIHPLAFLKLSLEDAYQQNWSHTGLTPGLKSADSAVFLPARNLLLITKAFLFLKNKKVSNIALGTLKGNPFPDGNRKYLDKLETLLSTSFKSPLKIKTPFHKFEKTQLIHQFRKFPLHLSASCINPNGIYHCGKCNKCAERKRAFQKAGQVDKTKYVPIRRKRRQTNF